MERRRRVHSPVGAVGSGVEIRDDAISLPILWSHPFILPPVVLVLLWTLTLFFAHGQLAWIVLSISSSLATLAYFGLLATLWLSGTAGCRDEGRRGRVKETRELLDVDLLHVGPGCVGMSMSPGRKRKGSQRNLDRDLAQLRAERFDIIFTLLQQREMEVMEIAEMGKAVASHGMEWRHLAIRDKWIPMNTREFLKQGVAPLVRMLKEGRKVLVHCNGGKGRTGTLVAAALMTLSLSSGAGVRNLQSATAALRGTRRGMLKNPLQRLYLRHLLGTLRRI